MFICLFFYLLLVHVFMYGSWHSCRNKLCASASCIDSCDRSKYRVCPIYLDISCLVVAGTETAQAARTHRLFLLMAVEYDCREAVLCLCLEDLQLTHITDLLPYTPGGRDGSGAMLCYDGYPTLAGRRAAIVATSWGADAIVNDLLQECTGTFSPLPSPTQSQPPLLGRLYHTGRPAQTAPGCYAPGQAPVASIRTVASVLGPSVIPPFLLQYTAGCFPYCAPERVAVPTQVMRMLASATQSLQAGGFGVSPDALVAEVSELHICLYERYS